MLTWIASGTKVDVGFPHRRSPNLNAEDRSKLHLWDFGSVWLFLRASGGMILALCAQFSLLAQEKAVVPSYQQTAVVVPFIGCRSDGQVGPTKAPKGTSTPVQIDRKAADELAYYRSAQSVGVLAPRGWYCYGLYGSGGDALFVSPVPIDTANIFSTRRKGFAGPAIEISHRFGDTSV